MRRFWRAWRASGPEPPRRGARTRVAADVEAELRFHIQGVADELVGAGMSLGEARAEAMRRFGDIARIGAECEQIDRDRLRRQRRLGIMSTVLADVRYSLRVVRRSPGFALMAVLTLASGMGATTAMFTVIDSVLLRPLPLGSPERLFLIWERNSAQGIERDRPSPPNFLDWRASSRAFVGMTAMSDRSMTLTGVDRPEVLPGAGVTADFLNVLGVSPLLGRGFAEGDDEGGGRRVVVLSHGAWQRIFGGETSVVGRAMLLDGSPYEVIGVMPAAFRVPRADIAVWVPFDMSREHRQSRYLTVIGRLAAGVTSSQAEQEMRGIAHDLAQQYPEANTGFEPYLVSVHDQLVGNARTVLLVVFCAVGFVLLLACTNVASLVLSRATAREGEIAVRAALGATAGRIRALLIAENLVLAVLGGVLGSGFAWAALRLLVAWAPDAIPRADELTLDMRVLAFAVLISLLTGVLLGTLPALRVARTSVTDLLREGSPRGTGGPRRELSRRLLIVAEVTLSLILLVGAGLSLRSLAELRAVQPGFETERILAARVNLTGPRYGEGPLAGQNARKVAYFDELLDRVRAIPGVAHAGVTSTLPLTATGIDFDLPYRADGMPLVPESLSPQVDYRIISPGYLGALGIRLVQGREFDSFDRADAKPVLLVNESFAAKHWPGENPVGKNVFVFYVQDTAWEVVGVVTDTRHTGLSAEPEAQIFVPMAQAQLLFGYMTIVVRTTRELPRLLDRLQDVAIAIDPSEPLYDFETMGSLIADATARDRLAALVLGAFALLAIALSAAGIYGVVSYQMARRTREIGVRIALGASRRDVLARVVGEAAGLALLGIALGGAIAAAGTRAVGSFLYGVSAHDPLTYLGVSALLLVMAMAAALVPALRAASVHPVQALRSE